MSWASSSWERSPVPTMATPSWIIARPRRRNGDSITRNPRTEPRPMAPLRQSTVLT